MQRGGAYVLTRDLWCIELVHTMHFPEFLLMICEGFGDLIDEVIRQISTHTKGHNRCWGPVCVVLAVVFVIDTGGYFHDFLTEPFRYLPESGTELVTRGEKLGPETLLLRALRFEVL